jgi:hypothetical protein
MSNDPYAATDKLDESLLQVVVTRLETQGRHPLFERMLQDYLDAMQIDEAKTSSTSAVAPALPRVRLLAAVGSRDGYLGLI